MDDLNTPSLKINGQSQLGFTGKMIFDNAGRSTKY